MSYVVAAWMPGTSKFIAQADGKWGFLDARSGDFQPDDNPKLVESACSKYHYKRIGPFTVDGPAAARKVAEDLSWP
jgi:hypothetical protein